MQQQSRMVPLVYIILSWTPSSDATGYIIQYNSSCGGSSGSKNISGGDTNSYTLTGLTSGVTYTTSIVATSQFLPSGAVTLGMAVGLGKFNTTPECVNIPRNLCSSWSTNS